MPTVRRRITTHALGSEVVGPQATFRRDLSANMSRAVGDDAESLSA